MDVDDWAAGTHGLVIEDAAHSRWVIVGLPFPMSPGSLWHVRVEPREIRRRDGGGRHLHVVS